MAISEVIHPVGAVRNAHGTEPIIDAINTRAGIVDAVVRLGDAGGYVGVVDHVLIEQDDDGDYLIPNAEGAFFTTLEDAITAATAQLATS